MIAQTGRIINHRALLRRGLLIYPPLDPICRRSSTIVSSGSDFRDTGSSVINNQKITTRSLTSNNSFTNEEVEKYKKAFHGMDGWLDMSILSKEGRAYEPATEISSPGQSSLVFPNLSCSPLTSGNSISIPGDLDACVKLVAFSLKHYGFLRNRAWIDAFEAEFKTPLNPLNSKVVMAEMCFVEFSFLSIAKGLVTQGIKNQLQPSQIDSTYVKFGGVMELAHKLLLPNAYTGYIYLLDKQNRVRWKACGEAKPAELDMMIKFVKQIAAEKDSK